MLHILTLQGSPRRRGNTATVLGCFEEFAVEVGHGGTDLTVSARVLDCWCFSSQMKAIVDRHYYLTQWRAPGGKRSLLAGKRAVLLGNLRRRDREQRRCDPGDL